MCATIIREKQDLTYLNWSHIRSSSGTAGTFLKATSELGGVKRYYKLSNFDPVRGVVGHECINEIIADRLMTLLGVEHLSYELIYADIETEGITYTTYLCASEDYKQPGESKTALDNYYQVNSRLGESHYDFCVRMGWQEYIDRMIAFDYIILNRDRHGANIEVLRNARAHTLRPAPLFDHGLSLLYSCQSDKSVRDFDVLEDRPCQNFIGSHSCLKNLSLLRDRRGVFTGRLEQTDRDKVLCGLEGTVSDILLERMWDMIWMRYQFFMEGGK